MSAVRQAPDNNLPMPQKPRATLPAILSLLDRPRRLELLGMLGGILALACLEMASVATLALMAAVIADPGSLLASPRLAGFPALAAFLRALGHTRLILAVSAAAGVLLAAKNAGAALLAYASASLGARLDAHFGELLLAAILRKPYPWRLCRNTADLFTLVTWRKHLGAGILFMIIQTVADVLVICFLLAGLLVVSPLVSGLLLGAAALAGFAVLRLSRPYFEKVGARYKAAEGDVNRQVTQTLQGNKEITLFGLIPVALADFRARANRYAQLEGIYRLLSRLPSLVFEVMGFGILFLTIAVLLWRNQGSPAAILGVLTLLTVTAWRVLNAVNRILSSISAIRLDLPPARKVLEHLTDIPADASPATAAPLAFGREITFSGVAFTYPDSPRPALAGIDLTIAQGQSLGIAGRSGSGKSTFVDVLIGLLPPDAGEVRVDGVALGPANARDFWHCVGYVGQNPFIADATLAENIAFGQPRERWDAARLTRCCRLAHVDEFLTVLPAGLDTPLGEGGAKLSGGQRQRVAIARALYREPDLLILDEATSALDMSSENALAETIKELAGQVTLVVVAHRPNTLAACETMLWLEDGRVREYGPIDDVFDRFNREMLRRD